MGATPDRPATRPCQVSSVPMPRGETSPTPVTTTLRSAATDAPRLVDGPAEDAAGRLRLLLLGLVAVLLDVVDGFLHTGDLLGVLVGDLDPELLLEGHHQLDRVQAVRSQV